MSFRLEVEHDNDTEIVIHVNKLKEGWDVTNLYTIVPLRASASEILTEQTIGRGLRLPYGQRTGVEAVDRLTIIAHDRFQEIVDRAKEEDSFIRKTIYIGGDDADVPDKKPQVITTPSLLEMTLTGKQATSNGNAMRSDDHKYPKPPVFIEEDDRRKIAEAALQVIREETNRLPSSRALEDEAKQQEIARKVQHRIQPRQGALPGIDETDLTNSVADIVKLVSENITKLTIDIPQIVVVPTREVNYGFSDFDLQGLEAVNYAPVSQEILLQHLEGEQVRDFIHVGEEQAQEVRLEDYIVRNLMDMNEIDYDSHANLLYKLAGQVVTHLQKKWQERDKVENILIYYQRQIREFIWAQMKANLWTTPTDYRANVVKGFDVLEPNTYSIAGNEQPRDFRAPVDKKSQVKSMLFTGFQRCCYPYQKFDSVEGELALARVLEADNSVLKWMKPASGKFRIEYKSSERYEPDFVVETQDLCLLIEPKQRKEINDSDVQAKKRAAKRWRLYATEHAEQVGGKPWKYLLIPHDDILTNPTLEGLTFKYS